MDVLMPKHLLLATWIRGANMTDLTYTTDKMFTRFYAETPAGEAAWRQIHDQNGGFAGCFAFETARVLQQLRTAGFKVAKAKKSNVSIADIADEIEKNS